MSHWTDHSDSLDHHLDIDPVPDDPMAPITVDRTRVATTGTSHRAEAGVMAATSRRLRREAAAGRTEVGRAGSWTPAQVRALGVTTTVPVAASILGIGRTLAYELAAAGRFPVPVIRAGGRLLVPVAPLLVLLGLNPGDSPDGVGLDPAGPSSVDRPAPADSRHGGWVDGAEGGAR
jgi:hypothetical protein